MEINRMYTNRKSMKLKVNSLEKMINKIDKPKTILTKETKKK